MGAFSGSKGGGGRYGTKQSDGGRGKRRSKGQFGRDWSHSSKPAADADGKKQSKRRGWFGAGSDSKKEKQQKKGDPRDWAREAVLKTIPDSKASPLVRIRTKVPWRASSGKSMTVYPLGHDEFWKKYFGQRAFVLRRGSHHPALLTPTEAAGLIRGSKLGVDSDMMGPSSWNRDAKRPTYMPEHGLPAVAALARGKPIRIQNIERKAETRLFRRDPLLAAMKRLAPGRGLGASLHWTPPNVRSVWEHEAYYDQIILQVYGVRKWTVCTRGLPPSIPSEKPAAPLRHPQRQEDNELRETVPHRREGTCVNATLRRGDVLYLPSWTWHWTGAGPKASAHLELGVVPLNGADLVMALGAKGRLSEMGHPAMAAPLALWRHTNAESAADDIIPHCYDLPWADGPAFAPVLCSLTSVGMALQRLSGSSGRPLPHWHPSHGGARQPERPWPRGVRDRGFFGPFMEVAQPLAQIFGVLGILMLLLCFCAASSNEGKKYGQPQRQGRSAHTIRQERALIRKSRTAMQQAARKKKLD